VNCLLNIEQVIHLLVGEDGIILNPGPLTEDEDPMVAGLERISHYFGEYPEDFAKRLDEDLPKDQQIYQLLLQVFNAELKKPGNYEPFLNYKLAQAAKEDAGFVWSFMSKLDPLDRPTSRKLLEHPWFSS
jgi:hypothetical protein